MPTETENFEDVILREEIADAQRRAAGRIAAAKAEADRRAAIEQGAPGAALLHTDAEQRQWYRDNNLPAPTVIAPPPEADPPDGTPASELTPAQFARYLARVTNEKSAEPVPEMNAADMTPAEWAAWQARNGLGEVALGTGATGRYHARLEAEQKVRRERAREQREEAMLEELRGLRTQLATKPAPTEPTPEELERKKEIAALKTWADRYPRGPAL